MKLSAIAVIGVLGVLMVSALVVFSRELMEILGLTKPRMTKEARRNLEQMPRVEVLDEETVRRFRGQK